VSEHAARNQPVIDEFRANAGIVGGRYAGRNLLLVNAKGAKTGLVRVHPVIYTRDGTRYAIAASLAGADRNPAWYYNLVAHPDVEIEVGPERLKVRAAVAPEPERTRLYAKLAAEAPVFNDYQNKTSRIIPMIVFTPVA
jgi:deazaflavin-dependent oxidoreductase (nitroreductase family)